MSATERLFHAVLFELLAIVISILALKLVTDHQTDGLTLVVVLISVIAVVWNVIFNWVFDLFVTGAREKRSVLTRCVHSLLFEGGLLIFTIPMVAYVLKVDWLTAFMMDVGLTLLILVYTFIFNWCYDNARVMVINKLRQNREH